MVNDRLLLPLGKGAPRHICDDLLEPLAAKLIEFASRFNRPFDCAKRERLDNEYSEIRQSCGFSDNRLSESQRDRLDELEAEMRRMQEPPRAFDLDMLYRDYHVKVIVDWLKVNTSMDHARDLERTLYDPKKRFNTLEYKAGLRLNGGRVMDRRAVRKVINHHYELIRAMFPDAPPDLDELSPEMREVEAEILDDYSQVELEIREAGMYLRRASLLLRSRFGESEESRSFGGGQVETDGTAVAVVMSESDIPAEYRVPQFSNGKPLTAKIISDEEVYGVSGPYLSKNYNGPRLKLGKAYVYRHPEVAALADKVRRPGDDQGRNSD